MPDDSPGLTDDEVKRFQELGTKATVGLTDQEVSEFQSFGDRLTGKTTQATQPTPTTNAYEQRNTASPYTPPRRFPEKGIGVGTGVRGVKFQDAPKREGTLADYFDPNVEIPNRMDEMIQGGFKTMEQGAEQAYKGQRSGSLMDQVVGTTNAAGGFLTAAAAPIVGPLQNVAEGLTGGKLPAWSESPDENNDLGQDINHRVRQILGTPLTSPGDAIEGLKGLGLSEDKAIALVTAAGLLGGKAMSGAESGVGAIKKGVSGAIEQARVNRVPLETPKLPGIDVLNSAERGLVTPGSVNQVAGRLGAVDQPVGRTAPTLFRSPIDRSTPRPTASLTEISVADPSVNTGGQFVPRFSATTLEGAAERLGVIAGPDGVIGFGRSGGSRLAPGENAVIPASGPQGGVLKVSNTGIYEQTPDGRVYSRTLDDVAPGFRNNNPNPVGTPGGPETVYDVGDPQASVRFFDSTDRTVAGGNIPSRPLIGPTETPRPYGYDLARSRPAFQAEASPISEQGANTGVSARVEPGLAANLTPAELARLEQGMLSPGELQRLQQSRAASRGEGLGTNLSPGERASFERNVLSPGEQQRLQEARASQGRVTTRTPEARTGTEYNPNALVDINDSVRPTAAYAEPNVYNQTEVGFRTRPVDPIDLNRSVLETGEGGTTQAVPPRQPNLTSNKTGRTSIETLSQRPGSVVPPGPDTGPTLRRPDVSGTQDFAPGTTARLVDRGQGGAVRPNAATSAGETPAPPTSASGAFPEPDRPGGRVGGQNAAEGSVGPSAGSEPAAGFTRLYKGESPQDVVDRRRLAGQTEDSWFTDKREIADAYASPAFNGNGVVSYIDIPTSELNKFRASTLGIEAGNPTNSFVLPDELARTRQDVRLASSGKSNAGSGSPGIELLEVDPTVPIASGGRFDRYQESFRDQFGPEGQVISDSLGKVQARSREFTGRALTKLDDAFGKLSFGQRSEASTNLRQWVENKRPTPAWAAELVQEARNATKQNALNANEANLMIQDNVSGWRQMDATLEDIFSHKIKPEIRDALRAENHPSNKGPTPLTDRWMQENPGKPNPFTPKAPGTEPRLKSANGMYGEAEQARVYNIPEEFMPDDSYQTLRHHIMRTSVAAAENEVFRQTQTNAKTGFSTKTGGDLQRLYDQIEMRQGSEAARKAQNRVDRILGRRAGDSLSGKSERMTKVTNFVERTLGKSAASLVPEGSKTVNRLNAIAVTGGKLAGSIIQPIQQTSQMVNNFIAGGKSPLVQGLKEVARLGRKEAIDISRKRGDILPDSYRQSLDLGDDSGGSLPTRVARAGVDITQIPQSYLDTTFRAVASHGADVHLKQITDSLKAGGRKAAWAHREMIRLDIPADYRASLSRGIVPPEVTNYVRQRWTASVNIEAGVTEFPRIYREGATSPAAAPLRSLKSFQISQGRWFAENVVKEAMHGNMKPALRWAVASTVLGEIMGEVRAKTGGPIKGRKDLEEIASDLSRGEFGSFGRRFGQDLMMGGAPGFVGPIAAYAMDTEQPDEAIVQLIAPVLASDAYQVAKGVRQGVKTNTIQETMVNGAMKGRLVTPKIGTPQDRTDAMAKSLGQALMKILPQVRKNMDTYRRYFEDGYATRKDLEKQGIRYTKPLVGIDVR